MIYFGSSRGGIKAAHSRTCSRRHFTPKVTEDFKEKFGQLLIDTGYEKDLNW